MSDPTPAPAADAPPKKSRKKLFLVLGLVILLAAGGAGAFFLLQSPSKGRQAHAAEKHAEPIYVALDPAFVVNFESSGLVRFLQITVQAMTEDPATADLIKKHDPVIRNALLMLFSGQTYDTIKMTEGKEKLRQAALGEVRRVVAAQGGKAGDVKSLYFTSFVMQ